MILRNALTVWLTIVIIDLSMALSQPEYRHFGLSQMLAACAGLGVIVMLQIVRVQLRSRFEQRFGQLRFITHRRRPMAHKSRRTYRRKQA